MFYQDSFVDTLHFEICPLLADLRGVLKWYLGSKFFMDTQMHREKNKGQRVASSASRVQLRSIYTDMDV